MLRAHIHFQCLSWLYYTHFLKFHATVNHKQCCPKIKCTLVQALQHCTGHMAHRGSRGIALLTKALEGGEGSASSPGHSLPLGKTRYPPYRRLGRPQGQSGQVGKISPLPGFHPWSVQPIASHYTDFATWPTCCPITVPNYQLDCSWSPLWSLPFSKPW